MSAGWAERLAPTLGAAGSLNDAVGITAVATPQGPALRVSYGAGRSPVVVPAGGAAWTPPDAAAEGAVGHRPLPRPGRRRGSRAPAHGAAAAGNRCRYRRPLRCLASRFRRRAGCSHRSERPDRRVRGLSQRSLGVGYDLFWRLRMMDCAGGEDFNMKLCRLASVNAFGLVVAGAVLAPLAARRGRRSPHTARHGEPRRT